jgi:hypothetical protein
MTYCSYNVYQVICLDPTLTVLKKLVDLAGLQSALSALKYSTLFAPTNAAFAQNAALTDYLLNPVNKNTLKNVLLYHICPQALTTEQLVPTRVLTMVEGHTTTIYAALYYTFLPVIQDQVQENYDVVEGNIATFCGNYIQKINGVMLPYVIYYPKVLNPPNDVWNAQQL